MRHLAALATTFIATAWLAPADAQTAARFVVDAGHSVRVGDIKFSPDGRYMATFDHAGKVVVRDLRSGAPVIELRGGEGRMSMGGGVLGGAMDFSPDGRWFVLGTTDRDTDEGVVSVRAVGRFQEVYKGRVHGLDAQDPRSLENLAFMANGDLVTQSVADRERGERPVVRAWKVGERGLSAASLVPHEAMLRRDSSGRVWLRSAANLLPPGLQEVRDSCRRPDGSGIALMRDGGLTVWNRSGSLQRVTVELPAVGSKDWFALHCMDGAPGAWLFVLRDVTNSGANMVWLSDKTLYHWMPGQPRWTLLKHLGPVALNAVSGIPGSADLMVNLGNRLLRLRPGVDSPVAEMPSSAGRIGGMGATPDGTGLVFDARYSYFLGGEYKPATYPRSARLFDLRSGRQLDASGEADCSRSGTMVMECAPFAGGYHFPALRLRSLGGAPGPALPAALASKGMTLDDLKDWSSDGRRVIGRQRVKDGKGERTLDWWHDLQTGRMVELQGDWPEGDEFSVWQHWLSPDLDLATVGLGADGRRASQGSRVRRVLVHRLPDREPLGGWTVPEGQEDELIDSSPMHRLLAVLRRTDDKPDLELFVRRFDGSVILQQKLPAAMKGVLQFEADGSALWGLEAVAPGRARLHRMALTSETTLSTFDITVLGNAQDLATLGPRGLAIGTSDGAIHFVDRGGKELATYFAFPDGQWLTMLPSGHYMASSQNVAARLYATDAQGQRYRLDAVEERFYRPDLVQMALAGQPLPPNIGTVDQLKPAPALAVVPPPAQVQGDALELQLLLTDRGGGVGEVRAFVNGSAVAQVQARDLGIAQAAAAQVRRLPLRLARGDNEIRLVAFNADGSMSSAPAVVRVQSVQSTERKPALHALVVGINEFENPRLKLTYAVPDATAIAGVLRQRAQGIFGEVNVTLLTRREDTRREQLLAALQRYARVAPDDVFLFYVASHGTVEGDELASREYFLLTSNVGAVSERALRRDAISQSELKAAVARIPATKKALILDTCHSGAFGDSLALHTRGMAEEGALRVLSRAVGSTVLSASTSQQLALEGHEGHGIFSYVLLQGLLGKADSRGNGFVNTGDLANYVEDEVPRLAEKYQRKQYPTRFLEGQSFPLVMSR